MKTTMLRVAAIVAVVMAFTVISAQAQTMLKSGSFSVPFEFNVGGEVLPAGDYTVFVENQIIRVRKSDGKANAIALTQRTLGAGHIKTEVTLMFRQYGGRQYLTQLWLPDGIGRQLNRPRPQERELAQHTSTIEIKSERR